MYDSSASSASDVLSRGHCQEDAVLTTSVVSVIQTYNAANQRSLEFHCRVVCNDIGADRRNVEVTPMTLGANARKHFGGF